MSEGVRFVAPLLRVSIEEGFAPIGYVLLPAPAAAEISAHELMRRMELGKRRGFGSVKVAVRVGESRWKTSVFPQKGGGWFLPIKAAVTRAEGLEDGEAVEVELELL